MIWLRVLGKIGRMLGYYPWGLGLGRFLEPLRNLDEPYLYGTLKNLHSRVLRENLQKSSGSSPRNCRADPRTNLQEGGSESSPGSSRADPRGSPRNGGFPGGSSQSPRGQLPGIPRQILRPISMGGWNYLPGISGQTFGAIQKSGGSAWVSTRYLGIAWG